MSITMFMGPQCLLLAFIMAVGTTSTLICDFDRVQDIGGIKLDGLNFFNRTGEFWLMQSTYNLSEDFNNSRCVRARQKRLSFGKHILCKQFDYRNLSSTYRVEGISAKHWPYAKVKMVFSKGGSQEYYNHMSSIITQSWYGYHLRPPMWSFLYVQAGCVVVEALSDSSETFEKGTAAQHTKTAKCNGKKPHCELWQKWTTGGYEPDFVRRKENIDKCCYDFLLAHCNTSSILDIYDQEICKTELHE